MNVIEVLTNQISTRLDNSIEDVADIVDIVTEEGYGPLNYTKDVQRRFYQANREMLNDLDDMFNL